MNREKTKISKKIMGKRKSHISSKNSEKSANFREKYAKNAGISSKNRKKSTNFIKGQWKTRKIRLNIVKNPKISLKKISKKFEFFQNGMKNSANFTKETRKNHSVKSKYPPPTSTHSAVIFQKIYCQSQNYFKTQNQPWRIFWQIWRFRPIFKRN